MRRSGVTILGIGLVGSLICQAFYTLVGLGRLYENGWYADVQKVVSVLALLTWILIVVGFFVMVTANPTAPASSAPPGPTWNPSDREPSR